MTTVVADSKSSATLLHEFCRQHKLVVRYTVLLTGSSDNLSQNQDLTNNHTEDNNQGEKLQVSIDSGVKGLKLEESDLPAAPEGVQNREQRSKQNVESKKPVRKSLHKINVTVSNLVTANGQGPTKRAAKLEAAAVALEQLQKQMLVENDLKPLNNSHPHEKLNGIDPVVDRYNPVGQLNQLTHKLILPPVQYKFEIGPRPVVKRTIPENRIACTANIYDLSLTCVGATKKLAKKSTAQKLLELLRLATDGGDHAGVLCKPGTTLDGSVRGDMFGQDVSSVTDMDACTSDSGIVTQSRSHKMSDSDKLEVIVQESDNSGTCRPSRPLSGDTSPTSCDIAGMNLARVREQLRLIAPTEQAQHNADQFYASLRARTGKTLASLENMALNRAHTNYVQMLNEISEEQRIDIVYQELSERTDSGEFQCLVQMTCLPVAVCHAVGRTRDEARALAAHNALQYLRIVVRKP